MMFGYGLFLYKSVSLSEFLGDMNYSSESV